MILIRTDANPQIGMGHIMRCLSLADAFHADNQDIVFILADHGIESFIEEKGYKAIVLNSNYKMMEEELPLWPELHPQFIIVDSYFVTERYLEALHERTGIVYIDDLAAFAYPVDILVNYNVYGTNMDYGQLYSFNKQKPAFCLGVSYVPLRKMFQNLPQKEQRGTVKDILFSTGGSDELHLALNLIKVRPDKYNYHIIIGAMNADRNEIIKQAAGIENITLHENVDDMQSLIDSCDIAVSAAGSTLYEICACGVPLITYIIADNQISGANAFEELGLALNCGDVRKKGHGVEQILSEVENLAYDFQRRVNIGSKMQKLIDGKGATRLAECILRLLTAEGGRPKKSDNFRNELSD